MRSQYPTKQELEVAFKTIRHAQIPQIPDVVQALRSELTRQMPDMRVVKELISQDLALAGQILKKVNSPLFFRTSKVTSLSQAVGLMGLTRLTSLVTAEMVERMLSNPAGASRVVWESIMEQAHIAVAITRYVPSVNAEDVYLFGIMHDVGSLIFAERLPNYGYEWVLRASTPQSLLEHERSALQVDHSTVSFLLGSIWQLPETLTLAIYHHHNLDYQELADGAARTLVAIAQLTHALMALPFGSAELEEMVLYRDRARQELELGDDEWAVLCKQALEGRWLD